MLASRKVKNFQKSSAHQPPVICHRSERMDGLFHRDLTLKLSFLTLTMNDNDSNTKLLRQFCPRSCQLPSHRRNPAALPLKCSRN